MDSEERSGLVTQFLQVSGLTDRSIAEAALERAHWDLAIAVHRFFEYGIDDEGNARQPETGGAQPPSEAEGLRHRGGAAKTDAPAPGANERTSRPQVRDAAARGTGDGEDLGVWGYVFKILLFPLRLLSALQYVPIFGPALSMGWTFLRTLIPGLGVDPTVGMPPSGEMRRAIADAVAESKPQKFEGSLKDAASHAKQELKFLLVFLHNSNAADSQRFFTEVFLTPDFTSFVDGNLILWAESIADQRGFLGCKQLRVNSLPALAMISLVDGQMRVVWQHSGFLPCSELVTILAMKMEQYQPQLIAEQTERATLVADRQILQNQDADFEESLRADRAKAAEKKAQEEAERQAIAVQEAQEKEAVRLEAQRKIDLEEKRNRLPPPPPAGEADTVRLRFQFPNGKFKERAFRTADTIQTLYDFVDTTEDNEISGNFSLFMNAPRRELQTQTDTLVAAGLDGGRQKIYVQDHEA